jgi:hypothetical protein
MQLHATLHSIKKGLSCGEARRGYGDGGGRV